MRGLLIILLGLGSGLLVGKILPEPLFFYVSGLVTGMGLLAGYLDFLRDRKERNIISNRRF